MTEEQQKKKQQRGKRFRKQKNKTEKCLREKTFRPSFISFILSFLTFCLSDGTVGLCDAVRSESLVSWSLGSEISSLTLMP